MNRLLMLKGEKEDYSTVDVTEFDLEKGRFRHFGIALPHFGRPGLRLRRAEGTGAPPVG